MAIGSVIRRNLACIVFPTLSVTAIWLDWSHTQKWKEQKKLQAA